MPWYHLRVSDVYALVRSIRENRLPRNRHFEEHQAPIAAEARRVHRFLRAVERDLRAATSIEVGPGAAGGVVVKMRFPKVRLQRVVALTPEEHALLVEDARLAGLLQPAAD
jgi:hypothetical protein